VYFSYLLDIQAIFHPTLTNCPLLNQFYTPLLIYPQKKSSSITLQCINLSEKILQRKQQNCIRCARSLWWRHSMSVRWCTQKEPKLSDKLVWVDSDEDWTVVAVKVVKLSSRVVDGR